MINISQTITTAVMLLCDAYKVHHVFQYPKNSKLVYGNWTPRKSRIDGCEAMVMFGPQMFCQRFLIDFFNEYFFKRSEEEVLKAYRRVIDNMLGELPSYDHIIKLHRLGYLPLKIKAVKEGEQNCPR